MFVQIAIYKILGLSVLVWLGIITYLLLISSAIIGHFVFKGKMKSGLKVHIMISSFTVLFATFHAALAILINL
ncbi:hypothetical protein ACFL3T_02875 [Patescibacteria group bacterium]